ncbi:nucleoside deaminase [soil metagenome]
MHEPVGPSDPAGSLAEPDARYLRMALAIAIRSRQDGHHPFGALVVDEHGKVVVEAANNSMPPDGDPTQHAERLAAAEAARILSPRALAKATLYSSAEPCAMCAGAIYWCNIGRVVYAMSEDDLRTLTGDHPDNPTLSLPCRDVLACGQRLVEVVGPVPELAPEAAVAHAGFWG